MTVAVLDLDWIRYAAGFVGEKREIQTIHKSTGDVRTFKNVTEFYGRGKAKNKGWIGEWNTSNPDSPVAFEDFDILEIQKPEPIANVLHTAKEMVNKSLAAVNADSYIAYYGRGDSFRVERSSIIKYKGNREHLKKPLLLPEITEYLEKKFGAIPCEGLEADDWCIISAYRKKDHVVISPDKDTGGCDVIWCNPNNDYKPVDCSGFGSLWIEEKTTANGRVDKTVRGIGQKFFLFQVAVGDSIDNYSANSASSIEWGDISGYNALKDSTNFREALEATVNVYKHLYPEPVEVEGWRGDIITVDWSYAFAENFDLARMLRWEDDKVDPLEVLRKYGIE